MVFRFATKAFASGEREMLDGGAEARMEGSLRLKAMKEVEGVFASKERNR